MKQEIILIGIFIILVIGIIYINSILSKYCLLKTTSNYFTGETERTTLCFNNKADLNSYIYYATRPLYASILREFYTNKTGLPFNETDFFRIARQ